LKWKREKSGDDAAKNRFGAARIFIVILLLVGVTGAILEKPFAVSS
jgi:hypothetical protein